MRSPRFCFLFFGLAALAWVPGTTRADWYPYTETVYTEPASTVFALPTSYVVPSAYVVPTTSIIPTVYATTYTPTSYTWTPTAYYRSAYVPTGYYVRERVARRPLFSRRRDYYVPTTIYYPTTTVVPTVSRYYAPTIFEYPVLSEVRYQTVTDSCGTCDSSVVVASAPAQERRVVRDEPAPRTAEPSRRDAVESKSNADDDQETIGSQVPPAPTDPGPAPNDLSPVEPPKKLAPIQSNKAEETPTPTQSKNSPPPSVAADGGNRTTAQPTPDANKEASPVKSGAAVAPEKKAAAPATGGLPSTDSLDLSEPPLPDAPVAPGGLDDEGLPPKTKREARKFSYDSPKPATLTLLKGRVRSSADSEPEDGVEVRLSSRTKAFEDRTTHSDGSGRFALRIPDGDWTVKVTMPSGRIYPVYRITVIGGTILDDQGQDVPALVITR